MTPNPPTLAGQFAELRRAAEQARAPIWLPEAIHALIVAMLLRIVGRLQDMAALWEAGLPIPMPAPRTRPHPQALPNEEATPEASPAETPRPPVARRFSGAQRPAPDSPFDPPCAVSAALASPMPRAIALPAVLAVARGATRAPRTPAAIPPLRLSFAAHSALFRMRLPPATRTRVLNVTI